MKPHFGIRWFNYQHMAWMTPSPIDRRLVELRLLGTPDQAEELAWIEEWAAWKASAGLAKYDLQRDAERVRNYQQNCELRREMSKRP